LSGLVFKHSWLLWCCFGWLALWRRSFPRSLLHTPPKTTLYLLVFLVFSHGVFRYSLDFFFQFFTIFIQACTP
jgi:hypothetical protein